jgi:hypothetical protein
MSPPTRGNAAYAAIVLAGGVAMGLAYAALDRLLGESTRLIARCVAAGAMFVWISLLARCAQSRFDRSPHSGSGGSGRDGEPGVAGGTLILRQHRHAVDH